MSPQLPDIGSKDLIRVLLSAGFVEQRQSGSHRTFRIPGPPPRTVSVPVGYRSLKKGTLIGILKQAGLTKQDLVELLKR